jgi:hypothetical protein
VTTVGGVVSAPYAVYSPSLVEIAIVLGGMALIAFVYTLAERYLDLSESEAHMTIWPVAWALARFTAVDLAARRLVARVPRIRRRTTVPPNDDETADSAQVTDSTD